MANKDKENKIKKFTKEAIGKTLNQFNKEIGIANLVEVNKNQDRILNGILSQVNDENTEKTEKSNIITLDNSTDGIVELKEIQGDTNVNVSKIEEMPITHDIGDKEGNVFSLNEITQGAISIGEIQGNTMVNCNKDDKKELVLMKDLSTQGYSNITLNKGVDGGKADVYLEGNTMVNVCDQKDPVAITKSYTVETGNHVALQGEYDGKCRPVVYGNTLVNLATMRGIYSRVDGGNGIVNTEVDLAYGLKPSTVYTRIVNVSKVILGTNSSISMYDAIHSSDGTYKQYTWINNNGSRILITTPGIYISKFTTSELGTQNIYEINPDIQAFNGSTGAELEISSIILLEGDYTNKPIPGYFEGLQSSFEDKVVPENLNVNEGQIINNNTLYYKNIISTSNVFTVYMDDTTRKIRLSINNTITNEWLRNINIQNKVTKIVLNDNEIIDGIVGGVTNPNKDNYHYSSLSEFNSKIIYLVEGDYTNYNFSDYDPTKAGKYKVDYVVTGKNKLKPIKGTRTVNGITYILNNDGSITANGTAVNYNAYLELRNNTKLPLEGTYTISGASGININGTYYNCPKTYTFNKNTSYRIYLTAGIGETRENYKYYPQLEEGNVVTPYEPYKEYKKTFYLNSPLLEGDTIEESGGNVYHVHRYKEIVLDGVNYIPVASSTNIADKKRWSIYKDKSVKNLDNSSIIATKNNKYCDINAGNTWGCSLDGIAQNSTGNSLFLYLEKYSDGSENSKQALINELQSNPLIVVYELASPISELISTNDTILTDSYVAGHLDFDTAVPVEKVRFATFGKNLKYLYPNTTYNIQLEADNVGKIYNLFCGGQGTTLLNLDVVKGVNKYSITTKDKPNSYIDIDGIGFNASNIVVTEATNQDFGYFEGMKSVGECEDLEVISRNRNLFDINSVYENTHNLDVEINESQIKISNPQQGYSRIDYVIPVNRVPARLSLSYKVVDSNGKYLVYLGLLDKDKKELTFRSSVQEEKAIILEKDVIDVIRDKVKYCMVSLEPAFVSTSDLVGGEYVIFKDILLVDDKSTDYIPHQSNSQQLTHEPLRAVGDVKDRYVQIDGKWYVERNIAKVSFNGSEAWWIQSSSDTHIKYQLSRFESKINKINSGIICDKFKHITASQSDLLNTEGIADGHSENYAIMLILAKSKNVLTLDDFKNYLSNNNLVILYILASPTYEPIDYNPFEVYSDVTHISNNSTIPCNMIIKNHGYNCLLKPSTTYTVSSNLGLNTVTTPSTLTEDCLRFYNTDTSTVTKMKNVTVLEGDYTTNGKPLPAHFSGIESAFEQEYDEEKGKYKVKAKVVGKNNIYPKNAELDYCGLHYSGNGLTTNITGTITATSPDPYLWSDKTAEKTYPHHVNSKQIVTCWSTDTNITLQVVYKKVATDKLYYSGGFRQGSVVIPEGYVIYGVRHLPRTIGQVINGTVTLQIELGDTATAYEPYKENYIEFYIDEPLRGVGDAKDKVYVKDDKVVVERKCGSVTFDGSDDKHIEQYMNSDNSKYLTFYVEHINNKYLTLKVMSDKFNNINYCWDAVIKQEGICGHLELPNIYFKIFKTKLPTQDVAGFKQYLQQNPTTVVYQLAEPTYEEIDYQEQRLILDTYNNSTLFYESNIPVSNTSFKPLWEELVYLKNSTKYYIQFNSTASGTVVFNLGGTEVTKDIVKGYNNIAIDTPAKTTNLLTIDGHGIKISEVVVSESVCGGHYLGLQSCFEEHMENGKYVCTIRGIALDGSKVNGIKLYLDEPLRGIGNVKDRLCIKNGKLMIERNCGSVTFDGSNDEKWYKVADGEYPEYLGVINTGYSFGKCNNFKYAHNGNYERFAIDGINLYIKIHNVKLQTQDITGFKQWLQQNPTTIVYELAEPVYEEVTNEYGYPIVLEGYENGIVYIDSAVTPTTHIKYTSNNQLATTLAEAEEQNVATQEDINMNVVTYMMDIDMILTEMEMSNDISVMAVRRDSSNENMLDRMSDEDKKVYRDNTVVMLEKMITAKVLEKEDIERRINMYYDKNRISKEQYEYLKSLL